MMKLPGNKIVFLLMYTCLPVLVKAQHFRYQCITDTVKQTGFYSIPITPEMSAHTQIDYKDVRVWNEKKQQVPYISRTRRPKWQSSSFTPFPIIENKLDDSGRSVIVVEKNVSYPIVNLTLILKSASVSRYASLSGSNNGKTWFIISEQILINKRYETLADSSIQSIYFPSSSYRYFKLLIDNSKTDPLNVVRIGYDVFLEFRNGSPYIDNPVPEINQIDSSNKISYIKVQQQQPFQVNQIRFQIDQPKYFSREIIISLPDLNREKSFSYLNEIARLPVSSTTIFFVPVPKFKASTFYISVDNGDNPPLTISAINTAQEYHELIAWLESGKQYTIMMEAGDAIAPTYDLQQFQDSIPLVVPTLSVGKIQPIIIVSEPDKKTPFPQKWLWLIMAVAVAILAMLTLRLTGEMRKKEIS